MLYTWVFYSSYVLLGRIACNTLTRPIAALVSRNSVVSPCVCPCVGSTSGVCRNEIKPIEMRLGAGNRLMWAQGTIISWGVQIGVTWRIRLNDPCAETMRPYLKLLLPFANVQTVVDWSINSTITFVFVFFYYWSWFCNNIDLIILSGTLTAQKIM